jgi:hypothetical protein
MSDSEHARKRCLGNIAGPPRGQHQTASRGNLFFGEGLFCESFHSCVGFGGGSSCEGGARRRRAHPENIASHVPWQTPDQRFFARAPKLAVAPAAAEPLLAPAAAFSSACGPRPTPAAPPPPTAGGSAVAKHGRGISVPVMVHRQRSLSPVSAKQWMGQARQAPVPQELETSRGICPGWAGPVVRHGRSWTSIGTSVWTSPGPRPSPGPCPRLG